MNNKTATFIAKLESRAPGRFTYEKTKYIDSRTEVTVTCSKCKTDRTSHARNFQRTDPKRIPHCSNCNKHSKHMVERKEKSKESDIVSEADFRSKIRETYGSMIKFTSFVYPTCAAYTSTPVTLTCTLHGDFTKAYWQMWQTCGRCDKCYPKNRKQNEICSWLETQGYEVKAEYTLYPTDHSGKKYRYDMFLPNKSLLIEYDGEQHFKYVAKFHKNGYSVQKQREIDVIKNQLAKEYGYHLLRIRYNDYTKYRSIISKQFQLLPKLKSPTVLYSRSNYYIKLQDARPQKVDYYQMQQMNDFLQKEFRPRILKQWEKYSGMFKIAIYNKFKICMKADQFRQLHSWVELDL